MSKRIKAICDGCKWAKWNIAPSGKRSGNGWCQYKYTPAPLPMSMYFMGLAKPHGGHITVSLTAEDVRRTDNVCPCWESGVKP